MERGRQTDLMYIAMHSTGDRRSNFIICALEKVMSMIRRESHTWQKFLKCIFKMLDI